MEGLKWPSRSIIAATLLRRILTGAEQDTTMLNFFFLKRIRNNIKSTNVHAITWFIIKFLVILNRHAKDKIYLQCLLELSSWCHFKSQRHISKLFRKDIQLWEVLPRNAVCIQGGCLKATSQVFWTCPTRKTLRDSVLAGKIVSVSWPLKGSASPV